MGYRKQPLSWSLDKRPFFPCEVLLVDGLTGTAGHRPGPTTRESQASSGVGVEGGGQASEVG